MKLVCVEFGAEGIAVEHWEVLNGRACVLLTELETVTHMLHDFGHLEVFTAACMEFE